MAEEEREYNLKRLWTYHTLCMSGYFVQRMKAINGNGAVRLAGYSFGACVAVEMALQLQQQGPGCGSLVLLDGSHLFFAADIDSTLQRLELSGDEAVAYAEAADICAFVSLYALRLTNSPEVCDVCQL